MKPLKRADAESSKGPSRIILAGIVAVMVLVFAWLMMHSGSEPFSRHTVNPGPASISTPPSN